MAAADPTVARELALAANAQYYATRTAEQAADQAAAIRDGLRAWMVQQIDPDGQLDADELDKRLRHKRRQMMAAVTIRSVESRQEKARARRRRIVDEELDALLDHMRPLILAEAA